MNLQEDLKQAMRDKDTVKLNVLRGLKNGITNAALLKGNAQTELSELEIIGLIRKQIAQRLDSIKQFRDASRDELADNEQKEVDILQSYLPVELDEAEIDELINLVIADLNATTKKDMGGVIKECVARAAGRADNKTISMKVGAKLI